MADQQLAGKPGLIREDLNVPVVDGVVTSDARIRAALPTKKMAQEAGSNVILMSHLGRPKEGGSAQENAGFSLKPVAEHLSALLETRVELISDRENQEAIEAAHDADAICMLENVRFNVGEKADEESLARQYASLCDIFVMDAFGTAHRAQASTHGVARYAPVACAGPLLAAELDALSKALENPARPLVAIVGGSKVSTKLTVLEALVEKVDRLVVGGGIANTFLAADGYPVGKSLCEHDLLDTARSLARKTSIPLPTDVVTGKEFSVNAVAEAKSAGEVEENDMIFDIGPDSAEVLGQILGEAKTILWNGPVGVFEFDQFGGGTRALALAIAESNAFSIAGGGDTLAAIDKYGVGDKISYISTGGGAFLEFVEGKTLPAVAVLEARASE